jgi:hypothetical protein
MLLLPDVTAFGVLAVSHDLLVPTLAVVVVLAIYLLVTTRIR